MDFGAIIRSLANFNSPELWLYMILGIAIGLFFGIVPGISGMTAITLLLPFIFNMKPMTALPLIMVILATQYLGGGITAILLNVPGTSGNAATLLDGYPLSQRGEAGRAVGAAEAAGGLAHILTAGVALLIIPLIVPMLRAIISADMVFIVLTGIVFIGTLAGGSMIKGLISGGLGLMIAIEFEEPVAKAVAAACLENGLIANAIGENIIRFLPPLVVTKEEVDQAVGILASAIRAGELVPGGKGR